MILIESLPTDFKDPTVECEFSARFCPMFLYSSEPIDEKEVRKRIKRKSLPSLTRLLLLKAAMNDSSSQ